MGLYDFHIRDVLVCPYESYSRRVCRKENEFAVHEVK